MANLRIFIKPVCQGFVTLIARLSGFWHWLNKLRRQIGLWVWAPVVGRVVLWFGAFMALAYIGSGATARLLGAEPLTPTGLGAAHGASLLPLDGVDPSASKLGCSASAQGCRPQDAGSRTDGQTPKRRPKALTADGKVILNLADQKDLEKLPGIGAKRARAILSLRTRLGRFRRLTDLLRVRGIGYRMLRRLRPLVVLDKPKSKKSKGDS